MRVPASLTALPLEGGLVNVIRARLDAESIPVAELATVVTPGELERAGRFIHERDRRRHIIGRGLLRLALGSVVQERPDRLPLQTTDLGKPFVNDGPSFSISHSGNEVLIAIARDGRLGVDVEEVRTLKDLLSLARTSFTYSELAAVAALPEKERVRAFFRIWTRKEAMLKALGCGLSGLNGIAVTGDDVEGNALVRMDEPPELEQWVVRSVPVDAAVEAAVAWDQPLLRLNRIDL